MLSSIEYYINETVLNYFEDDHPKSISTTLEVKVLPNHKYSLSIEEGKFVSLIVEEQEELCGIKKAGEWLAIMRNIKDIFNKLNPTQTTYDLGGIYIHGIKQHLLLSSERSIELTTRRKCNLVIFEPSFYVNSWIAKIYMILKCREVELLDQVMNIGVGIIDSDDKYTFLRNIAPPESNIFRDFKKSLP
jgi:hypothetical protein